MLSRPLLFCFMSILLGTKRKKRNKKESNIPDPVVKPSEQSSESDTKKERKSGLYLVSLYTCSQYRELYYCRRFDDILYCTIVNYKNAYIWYINIPKLKVHVCVIGYRIKSAQHLKIREGKKRIYIHYIYLCWNVYILYNIMY